MRRYLLPLVVVATIASLWTNDISAIAKTAVDPDIAVKFNFLSNNGNSTCSGTFQRSIANMSPGQRLQGSCCTEMALHRYSEQIEGLRQYADIDIIPPDPYDVEARLAQKLNAAYELALTTDEQRAYDYAMEHSREKGPCCCQCWRWHVYGGLAKLLIREHGFTGEQVTAVWNLSDGCGGDEDHEHQ